MAGFRSLMHVFPQALAGRADFAAGTCWHRFVRRRSAIS